MILRAHGGLPDGPTLLQRKLALLLQLCEAIHIKLMLYEEFPLPGEEEPLHQVLVSRVPRGEEEVSIADEKPSGGGEEGDGLHDVPRELPEGEAEEEAHLQDEEPKTGPEDVANLSVCQLVNLLFPLQ